jgi:hypothetical protein
VTSKRQLCGPEKPTKSDEQWSVFKRLPSRAARSCERCPNLRSSFSGEVSKRAPPLGEPRHATSPTSPPAPLTFNARDPQKPSTLKSWFVATAASTTSATVMPGRTDRLADSAAARARAELPAFEQFESCRRIRTNPLAISAVGSRIVKVPAYALPLSRERRYCPVE